jgi:lysophospholipase L1-like esterase
MLECIILGDSIAKGISMAYPECKSYSVVGISSSNWSKTFGHVDLKAATVVVSLGANDKGLSMQDQLVQILSVRDRIKSKNIVWINPPCNDLFCNKYANYAVQTISTIFSDTLLETVKLSKDGIHPTQEGYKEMAALIKAKAKPQTVLPMWPSDRWGQTTLGPPSYLLPQN